MIVGMLFSFATTWVTEDYQGEKNNSITRISNCQSLNKDILHICKQNIKIIAQK